MDGFFRSIPYSLTDRQNEQMWQTIVWTVLKSVALSQKRITLIGLGFSSERRTVTDSAVEQL